MNSILVLQRCTEDKLRNIQGKVPESALSRFLLGAGVGIAVSIPIFAGIEDATVRFSFMTAFSGLMGIGQVLAGSKSVRVRPMTKLSLLFGALALIAGLVFFVMLNE